MRKVIYHPLFGNDFQMTTYVARYSFASIAASIGIDRETSHFALVIRGLTLQTTISTMIESVLMRLCKR